MMNDYNDPEPEPPQEYPNGDRLLQMIGLVLILAGLGVLGGMALAWWAWAR